jgi:hypothetical protein
MKLIQMYFGRFGLEFGRSGKLLNFPVAKGGGAAFSYLHGGDLSVQCHEVHEAVAGQARL